MAQSLDFNQRIEKIKAEPALAKVYFYAWGGGEPSNGYIEWVANQVKSLYGIELTHVKIADTNLAVRQVLSEKAVGENEQGKIDLIWINGENFRAMKDNNLLFGPFTEQLPNWQYLDIEGNPNLTHDFTIPTQGYEMPWGQARLVFYYDPLKTPNPPLTPQAFLDYAKLHPNRLTFPAPPDFTGTSLLKQLLISLSNGDNALNSPVILEGEGANFDQITAPLWAYMDELTPLLWKKGQDYPTNKSSLLQLFSQNIVDIGFSFDMAEAANAISQGILKEQIRSFVWEGGTLGNSHFLAIPYNSPHQDASMIVANFMLSPIAQAHKQDASVWGDATVLDLNRLEPEQRKLFDDVPSHAALLSPTQLGKPLSEPHPSWVEPLEQAWLKRYGNR